MPGPFKLLGDSERLTRKPGPHRKVHLALNTGTSDLGVVQFTASRMGDRPVLADLLDHIPPIEPIGTKTGDSAFATRRGHPAILDCRDIAVILLRKTGRLWRDDGPAARVPKRLGQANV